MKMTLSGVEQIRSDLSAVSRFVADPNRVGTCLPDVQELTVADDQHFTAFVRIGIGPIRGRFKMEVELQPSGGGSEMAMRLKGSGMGNGLAMASTMKLVPAAPDRTELHWSAEASVSGPLAGVGGRLLEGQAKKTTEALFTNIRQALESARV
jgi:uncharacterized protein